MASSIGMKNSSVSVKFWSQFSIVTVYMIESSHGAIIFDNFVFPNHG